MLLATVSMGCSNGQQADNLEEMPEKDTNNSPPNLMGDKDFLALIEKLNPRLDVSTIENIALTIEKYSSQYQVPTNLIISVIAAESEFHPKLLGALDDTGLMQIRLNMFYWAEMMVLKPQNSERIIGYRHKYTYGNIYLKKTFRSL